MKHKSKETNKEKKINAFINSKKSSNFWLMLILADVLLILFFGYLIYKSIFTTHIYDDVVIIKQEVVQETEPEPEIEKPKPVVEKKAVEPEKTEPKISVISERASSKTRKVTFRYFDDAREVAVVGGFTMRKPWAMKNKGEYWETSMVIYPGRYRYLFIVDGEEISDPHAKEYEDGKSVMVIK